MAQKKNSVSKSEEIRLLLKANPEMPVKEVLSTLQGKGIKVTDTLVYYVKGKSTGRKARRKKASQMVVNVAATGNSDPVATILKVKKWASEVGGLQEAQGIGGCFDRVTRGGDIIFSFRAGATFDHRQRAVQVGHGDADVHQEAGGGGAAIWYKNPPNGPGTLLFGFGSNLSN